MPESKDHFFGRHYDAILSTGPFRWLNPTKRYHHAEKIPTSATADVYQQALVRPQGPIPKILYIWSSRDNRKGRHGIVVDRDVREHSGQNAPKPSNTWQQTGRGIWKMMVRYPVWDVSYDVAVVFTIGSVIWVINGFFSWLPIEAPSTEFPGETSWGGGLTAFIGATVFEFGSVLLMLEAVNENRSDCFGWAVEESLDGFLNIRPDHGCRHHHVEKRTFVASTGSEDDYETVQQKAGRKWSWWPTWYELKTHYFRDIGFLACLSQMIGATIFWIAGITSLPPIIDNLSTRAQNGVYWAPQVIGGTGFVISSTLFMVEVQPRWYIPAPGVLGWHIGFWNLIGAIGFTLCGALGFGESHPGVEYALTLSTFVGSWAFLLGSAIQWFESLDKYPIWVDKSVRSLTGESRLELGT